MQLFTVNLKITIFTTSFPILTNNKKSINYRIFDPQFKKVNVRQITNSKATF